MSDAVLGRLVLDFEQELDAQAPLDMDVWSRLRERVQELMASPALTARARKDLGVVVLQIEAGATVDMPDGAAFRADRVREIVHAIKGCGQ